MGYIISATTQYVPNVQLVYIVYIACTISHEHYMRFARWFCILYPQGTHGGVPLLHRAPCVSSAALVAFTAWFRYHIRMKTILHPAICVIVCFTASTVLCMKTTDARPLHDLPRLPDTLAIDGTADDWGSAGLRVVAWAEDGAPPLDPALFSAELRLGWTARGLAALLDLRSTLPWSEAQDTHLAYTADSVEVFVRASNEWKELVQAVITPGLAPGHAAPRSFIYDYRGAKEEWADIPTAVEVSRTRTDRGCTLEVLVPWHQLRVAAAAAATCEFSIKINKIIPGAGRRQFTWPAPNGDAFQRLRLAEGGSATLDTAAWMARDGFERMGVCAVAPRALAGTFVSVRRGAREELRTRLAADGDRASACVWMTIPHAGTTALTVAIGGVRAAQVPVPDLRTEARRELERVARMTRGWRGADRAGRTRVSVPALLTHAVLPDVTGLDPAIARLAGVERVEVRWYDADGAQVERAERPGRYGAVVTLQCTNDTPVVYCLTCVRVPDGFSMPDSLRACVERLAGTNMLDAQSEQALTQLRQRTQDALLHERDLAVLLAGAMEASADGGMLRPFTRDRAWWHTLRTRLGIATTYTWFKLLPKAYDAQPDTRWPAVIYLHGSGGELPRDYTPLAQRTPERDLIGWAMSTNLPLAIYALQSFGGWEPPAVIDALKSILAEDRIDPERITVMGFSMGGMGTWECAVDYPEWFAAAVPIGGRAYRAHDCGVLAGRLPVWVFNGDADMTTTLADAERAVQALKAAGGDVRLTVLPGADHGASQNGTFNTPGLWEWVLAQRRRAPTP